MSGTARFELNAFPIFSPRPPMEPSTLWSIIVSRSGDEDEALIPSIQDLMFTEMAGLAAGFVYVKLPNLPLYFGFYGSPEQKAASTLHPVSTRARRRTRRCRKGKRSRYTYLTFTVCGVACKSIEEIEEVFAPKLR